MPGLGRLRRGRSRVRESFEVPVLVDNDVNLMALGEHVTAFPDVEHLLFVKVATGIGVRHRSATVACIAGPRARPATSATCSPPTAATGNAAAATSAVSRPSPAARRSRRSCGAQGLDTHDSADVVELVKAGNLVAAKAVRQAGRDIGDVLAACVSMLNPSVIVIGGSLAQAGEKLLAGVREAVYGRSLPLATEHLRIVTSRTAGHAAVLGASTMVVQHALSPATIDAMLA